MPNPTLSRLQSLFRSAMASPAINQWIDRRVILGVLLGGSVMATGYAVSSDNVLFNYFVPVKSDSITQQASAINEQMLADKKCCAEGCPGSIGAAIKNAVAIHTEIASAGPAVEELFNIDDSCFAGLSQIFDLSPTIPSLGSIMTSAQGAVMKFAQKKVCSAVNKVTGMVTQPLNQAIANINKLEGYQDLNGFTQDAIGNGMESLDPTLGQAYAGTAPKGDTYTINPNAFSDSQTAFTGTTASSGKTGTTSLSSGSGSTSSAAPAARTYLDSLSDVFK